MRKTLPVALISLFLTGCSVTLPSVVYPGDEGYVTETLQDVIDEYVDELSKAVDDVVNLGSDETESTDGISSDKEKSESIKQSIQERANETYAVSSSAYEDFSLDLISDYEDSPYCVVNNNVPYFTEAEIEEAYTSYIYLSELDELGRCGYTMASIATDIMPTGEERDDISSVTPSGWDQAYYEWIDNGGWLYNRCHLLGWQLTGLNAEEKNLITGTRYLNVDGMLPFENEIADYCYETDNHVLYRVTPIFDGDNLVADGVLMEALSIEDSGEGVEFNVFCYNVQPGVWIDYATGESFPDD